MTRFGFAVLLGVAGACAAGLPALAQGRPYTPAMRCTDAAALVRARGAIVLRTGGHRYDRYVSNRSFCQHDEDIRPQWVPTADNPQCMIGYICETVDPGQWPF